MIPAIACSIYILYLYRKLSARPSPAGCDDTDASAALRAEIVTLDARIDALESRLPSGRQAVTR